MRLILLTGLSLLTACAPSYVVHQQSGYVSYPRAPHAAARAGSTGDCAHDSEACPEPPLTSDPSGPHLPSLLPYSGPDSPSYD